MTFFYEAWCIGAESPLGSCRNRNRARTSIIVQAGFMCQDGDWLYSSSRFVTSNNQSDIIVLEKADDPNIKCEFYVSAVKGT